MPGRVFKRGSIYWCAFSHHGKEYRHSCKTESKREAESVLSHYLGQCARGEFKGFEDDRLTYTVGEMLADFIDDCERRGLRAMDTVITRLSSARKELGAIPADALTERMLDLYIKKRQDTGRMPATLKNEMGYLRQAYKLAMRKKLVKEMPHIPTFKVNNARQGFFEREDFDAVLALLPDYLKNFARFAYLTGWRKKEISTLEWRDIVDDVIRLRPDVSKTSEGRLLIMVGEIAEIIEEQRLMRDDLLPYVFHWKRKRIYYIQTQWDRAVAKAGQTGKLFHDFRRTAVRNMVRAGVPERVAMQISGHKTRTVFDRYNIVSEEDIREGLIKTQQYISQKEKGTKKTIALARKRT